jgi:hypothetical protein
MVANLQSVTYVIKSQAVAKSLRVFMILAFLIFGVTGTLNS